MSAYQIQSAALVKKLPPQGDRPELAVHEYVLQANGQTTTAERVAKLDTPLPAVGSTIEGTIEDGRFGKRFKPDRPGGAFAAAAKPYKRDPSETRAIQRQHSQEMALRFVAIKAQLGKLDDFLFSDVQKITTAFENDLRGDTPKSDVPVDESGLTTVDQALADGKDVPF